MNLRRKSHENEWIVYKLPITTAHAIQILYKGINTV